MARLSRGWFYHYDRNKFETYIYSISPKIDKMSQEYQENSDYFYHLPNDLDRVIKQIREDELDILVFLDIGMFAPISILASLRLAPIQCTTWFHPETSGFNTIDYFLSSNLMEPDNAEEHYSETLIRLPNLAISYSKPEIPPITKTKKDFGLKEDVVTYLCCQSIFKYLPQHDYMILP